MRRCVRQMAVIVIAYLRATAAAIVPGHDVIFAGGVKAVGPVGVGDQAARAAVGVGGVGRFRESGARSRRREKEKTCASHRNEDFELTHIPRLLGLDPALTRQSSTRRRANVNELSAPSSKHLDG